jgi:hypothetical protein
LESPETGKDILRTRPFSRLQRPRAPHRNRGNARELRAFCRRPGKVGSDSNLEPIVSSGAGRTRTSAASIVLGPVVLLAKLPRLANGRRWIVLLLLGREALTFVEYKDRLCSGLVLLRLRDRRNEFGTASALNDLLGASSSSQCRCGYPYGEFRIGWSKNGFDIWVLGGGGDCINYSRIAPHFFQRLA